MFRKKYIDRMARESVVAHLTDDQSIRGVLVAVHRDCLVLAHASALHSGGSAPIDGEAVVPRSRVAWLQKLPPATEA